MCIHTLNINLYVIDPSTKIHGPYFGPFCKRSNKSTNFNFNDNNDQSLNGILIDCKIDGR